MSWNNSYLTGIRNSVGVHADGRTPKSGSLPPATKAANPAGNIQGTPLPGGGCYYQTPTGSPVQRLDVNCDGTFTPAAAARQGSGGTQDRSLPQNFPGGKAPSPLQPLTQNAPNAAPARPGPLHSLTQNGGPSNPFPPRYSPPRVFKPRSQMELDRLTYRRRMEQR